MTKERRFHKLWNRLSSITSIIHLQYSLVDFQSPSLRWRDQVMTHTADPVERISLSLNCLQEVPAAKGEHVLCTKR